MQRCLEGMRSYTCKWEPRGSVVGGRSLPGGWWRFLGNDARRTCPCTRAKAQASANGKRPADRLMCLCSNKVDSHSPAVEAPTHSFQLSLSLSAHIIVPIRSLPWYNPLDPFNPIPHRSTSDMAPLPQARPYRDFLTPALHKRFTDASFYTLLLCYCISLWMGSLDDCQWSPLNPS